MQKLKKVSSYDEYFVVATKSKIWDSFKNLTKTKLQTVKKLNRMLKLHSPAQPSSKLIAPKTPSLIQNNLQNRMKLFASQSLHHKTSLPTALQLAHQNKAINPYLKMPIASKIPLQNPKPQLALNNLPLHKSHSFNKFAAFTLQKSDNKKREQSEQFNPIKPIFDINSNNHHKFLKFCAKIQNSN